METSELFITRKRKKWKFAHFDEWPNCFSAQEAENKDWPAYFENNNPLVVEVGAGTADLSVGLAGRPARHNFVAVDIKSDRLYTGAKFSLEHKVKNIAFVRSGITGITNLFAPQSAQEVWITFPDPFERKKHAKHRLTHPAYLARYRQILMEDGKVHFKTDNRELFLWSLEQIVADGWHITELSFDLHESQLPDEYKITTAYERRFIKEGIPINFVTASL